MESKDEIKKLEIEKAVAQRQTEYEKKVEEIFKKMLKEALEIQAKVAFVQMAFCIIFGFVLGFVIRGIFWR